MHGSLNSFDQLSHFIFQSVDLLLILGLSMLKFLSIFLLLFQLNILLMDSLQHLFGEDSPLGYFFLNLLSDLNLIVELFELLLHL